LTAAAPSSWAGVFANAPLKDPTAVRAAPTTTISLAMTCLSLLSARACALRLARVRETASREPVAQAASAFAAARLS